MCSSNTPGLGTFASWKARCRAPRCARQSEISAPPTLNFCTPLSRRRRRAATGCDRSPSRTRPYNARLDAVQWNKKEASRVLDISRGTLFVPQNHRTEPRAAVGRGPACRDSDVWWVSRSWPICRALNRKLDPPNRKPIVGARTWFVGWCGRGLAAMRVPITPASGSAHC